MSRIYVDYDDVLCETAQELRRLLLAEFGKHVPFRAIRDFNLGVSFGLNDGQTRRLMAKAHERKCILGMQPVPGARRALTRWRSAGHEVAIVTGRPPGTERSSREWLDRHRMSYTEILFVDKYGRFKENERSGSIARLSDIPGMGFSLAIDDSPCMIEFLACRLNAPVIAFDRPWNRALSLPNRLRAGSGVVRCAGWREIEQWYDAHCDGKGRLLPAADKQQREGRCVG